MPKNRHTLLGLGLLFLFFLTINGEAYDPAELACLDNEPVWSKTEENVFLPENEMELLLASEKLPVSAERSDLITFANVNASLVKSWSGAYQLLFEFSFNDPRPFGLPYNFQYIEVNWSVNGKSKTQIIDWTQECHGPGRSMFPGQRPWNVTITLEDSKEKPVFKFIKMQLWGSRN